MKKEIEFLEQQIKELHDEIDSGGCTEEEAQSNYEVIKRIRKDLRRLKNTLTVIDGGMAWAAGGVRVGVAQGNLKLVRAS